MDAKPGLHLIAFVMESDECTLVQYCKRTFLVLTTLAYNPKLGSLSRVAGCADYDSAYLHQLADEIALCVTQ